MARCINCWKVCDGLACSKECAEERMTIMLEGVQLLDSLMAMVDKAAEEKNAGRAVAQPAPPPKAHRPSPKAEPESTMPLLAKLDGPEAPIPIGPPSMPNGLDAKMAS